jgi:nicotinamide phosphoribosyltransferase
MKDQIVASGATIVIRPDSGDPLVVLPKMLEILSRGFGCTINAKGYKVLNNVRIIWGDGIDSVSLYSIMRTMVDYHGYSMDNFAFGMGGGLLQKVNRDSLKFAMKCSAINITEECDLNGSVWREVFKDPITDPGKTSKKGLVSLFKDRATNEFYTSDTTKADWDNIDAMQTVFLNGNLLVNDTFEAIRARSND